MRARQRSTPGHGERVRREALHGEDRVGHRRGVREDLARDAQGAHALLGREQREHVRAAPSRATTSTGDRRSTSRSPRRAPAARRRAARALPRRTAASSTLALTTPVRGVLEVPGAPAKRIGRLAFQASYAARKSGCCMQMACACASASMACSSVIPCSLSSICLVIACANAGPLARRAREAPARSGGTRPPGRRG